VIARGLFWALAAIVAAGLVSTPESTVASDALRGAAMMATAALPLAVLYVVSRAAPRHRRYQRGHTRFAALGLFVLVALSAYVLRCTPHLPPVSGCTPYARRCSADGYTELCSASQRWHRDGDVPCSRLEQVCLEGACVDPPADAGAADGGAR